MKFCEKVKEARTKAGLKQDELAKAIGVSLRTISNYEAGTRYPKKRETYYKMAEVLKVDVNYLLTDDEEFLLNAESKYGSKDHQYESYQTHLFYRVRHETILHFSACITRAH